MIPQGKKIAVLHPSILEIGGAVKMMIYLSDKLSMNNKVVFYTTIFNQNNFDYKFNFPVYEINSKIKFISFLRIAYKIKDYDIVFAGNSPMHFVGILAKILFRAKFKLIWWNHHFPWYYEKKHNTFIIKLKALLEKFFIKYIDLLVANSIYIKRSLLDIFGQSRQIEILHPVVSSIFSINKQIESRQNKKIILFTYGRWVKGKNLNSIFDVYNSLNAKYDFDLIIGGEGDEIGFYKKEYANYTNIFFLGRLCEENILKLGKKADIFLFPSKIDSFGLVILEMMYLSLPIVGFNSGGVYELIKNGKNGFLCFSDEEFIEKTEKLIKNSSLRKKMSKKSFYFANKNFKNFFDKELERVI